MKHREGWTWVLVVCMFFAINLRAQQSGLGGDSSTAPPADSSSATGTTPGATPGAVPRLIKFSGVISPQTNPQVTQTTQNETREGGPATAVGVTFSLYELQEGGSPLWSESQQVQLDSRGRYGVLLGATNPEGLPLDLFTSGKALWLGVQPQLPGATEQPRVLLVAVPYALKAVDADTLGGKPATAYLTVSSQGQAGTTDASGSQGGAEGATGAKPTIPVASGNAAPLGVVGTATPGYLPMFVDSSGDVTNSLVSQSASNYLALNGDNLELSLGRSGGDTNGWARLGFDTSYNAYLASNATWTGSAWNYVQPYGYGGLATRLLYTYGNFQFDTASGGKNPIPWNTQFLIANNGNVGIGTANATEKVALRGDNMEISLGRSGGDTNGWARMGFDTSYRSYLASNATWNGSAWNYVQPYGYGGLATRLVYSYGAFQFDTASGAANPIPWSTRLYIANGGNVGIGTPSPAATLEVNGTARFDQPVTFAAGQNFPGMGTVTSVGSGAGLAGGPINTSGTLSIATAGVTNAMLANPSLTVSAGSGLSGGGPVSLGGVTTLTNTGVLGINTTGGLTNNSNAQNPTLSIAPAGVTDAMLADAYSGTGSCSSGQLVSALARNSGPTCVTAGTGTVTSITAGSGLSGGTITTTGTITNTGVLALTTGQGLTNTGSGQNPILSIPNGGVTNLMLQNQAIYVSAGTGLTGGASFNLGQGTTLSIKTDCASGQILQWNGAGWLCANLPTGGVSQITAGTDTTISPSGGTGNVTVNVDTTKVPQLNAANQFYPPSGNSGVAVSASSGGNAVVGTTDTGYGIAGSSNSGDGVYGYSGTGYAGYFFGNIDVTGKITAGTKDFKIDHPLDPADRYLYHASVESSEMMNIYTGNVTLDANGLAVVELPDWFEALNRDFRYQLTAIGAPAPGLYIAEEIANQHFKIAGGKPGMKVSWQVTGVRQDAYANAHPLQVEVEKPANERGYYIHPELYGAPPEKSIDWARNPGLMQRLKAEKEKPPAPVNPQ